LAKLSVVAQNGQFELHLFVIDSALPLMHKRAIPALRVRYLAAFCRALDERGFDTDTLLRQAGLEPVVLENLEAWLPVSQLCSFLELAVKETGYEALGLDAGIAPRQRHSMFSKLVLYTPTLYQSLRGVCSYSAREDTSAKFKVVREGNCGWMRCGSIEASPEGVRQIEAFRYSALLEIIRLAAGPDFLPLQLQFQSSDDSALGESPLLRDVDVQFGCRGLAIAFDAKLFSQPIANVPDLPMTKPEFSDAPVEFGSALVEMTRTQMLSGHPEIEHTAAALGMSARTLQRRLNEQDLSYMKLLQHVRMQTARTTLEEETTPIAEISEKLGYRHHTHFTRAFRQVCGVTPRDYRRMHSASDYG
jgi:AraC-like DNA-binding protein